MSLIGIHISDINNIIEQTNKHINFFQFFVQDIEKNKAIKKHIMNNKIYTVVHASYSINLANSWTDNDWWILQLISEIEFCNDIGAFAIVIHTGKQMHRKLPEALNNMYTALLHVHEQTIMYSNVKIIIETPAGQGSELLSKIADLCNFMNKFYKHPNKKVNDRFGICVDTCHIFAAGIDIRTLKTMNMFFDTIDKLIGIDKIKLCHLNDSTGKLNSKLDRHIRIGEGYIGKDPLIKIIRFLKKLMVPIILETNSDTIHQDYILVKKS